MHARQQGTSRMNENCKAIEMSLSYPWINCHVSEVTLVSFQGSGKQEPHREYFPSCGGVWLRLRCASSKILGQHRKPVFDDGQKDIELAMLPLLLTTIKSTSTSETTWKGEYLRDIAEKPNITAIQGIPRYASQIAALATLTKKNNLTCMDSFEIVHIAIETGNGSPEPNNKLMSLDKLIMHTFRTSIWHFEKLYRYVGPRGALSYEVRIWNSISADRISDYCEKHYRTYYLSAS
ncbi:uncharacterized protein PAC_15330 [Phialocephala subalpina]|uniref:Uncharacterized protein n=1 Tax=Phialocephala subalpina TaxID=576137 RepID=A0A1L7XK46_9HELO|nr:uncharacterized protein PAC_15330 [Phialocephala subalpina]